MGSRDSFSNVPCRTYSVLPHHAADSALSTMMGSQAGCTVVHMFS